MAEGGARKGLGGGEGKESAEQFLAGHGATTAFSCSGSHRTEGYGWVGYMNGTNRLPFKEETGSIEYMEEHVGTWGATRRMGPA